MVCLGNICRSPLAEGILKSKVNKKEVYVDSAGTGGWHIGELPDRRSVQIAGIHGVDITDQRCRQFETEDFDEFDEIYVMDKTNYRNVLSMARSNEDEMKVKMILDLIYPGRMMDVPDPYYGGEKGFENVYKMLDQACTVIAEKYL